MAPAGESALRSWLRREIPLCARTADERVGPTRINAVMGWNGGNQIKRAWAVALRQAELERAGFVIRRARWVRGCTFMVARDPAAAAPRGDLVRCGRTAEEHPVVGVGHFVNHDHMLRSA